MKIVSIDYKYWLANYLTQHKLGHMYVVMYQIDKNFRELLPHPVFQIRFIIYTVHSIQNIYYLYLKSMAKNIQLH